MTKDKGRLSLVISSLFMLLALGLAPASVGATELVPPTDNPDHAASPPTGTTGIESNTGTVTPDPKPPVDDFKLPSPEPMVTPQQTQTEVQNFQQQGNTYLLQMRDKQNHDQTKPPVNTTQTAAERQKHCEQMQMMVNKQVANFSKNAQTHLTVFNSVYAKVQAYAASKNASSTDFQALITTANTDQTNATQAVAALKTVAVTIDCTQTNPASSLATVKAAVDSTRTALQAYQKAISAVIANLESTSTTETQQ